jgi:antitoxin (DNA-binding transcriptional repressor) of toxin-antitoxin stability system
MDVFTYSEARQNMAALLDRADRGERIRIRRKDGHLFDLQRVRQSGSPLDVEGIDLGVSTAEIVELVRESRTRYDDPA